MTAGERPDPERYALSDDERLTRFVRKIAPVELERARPVPNPRVIYIGGQPGAGKSALQDRLRKRIESVDGPHTVLEINNDRLRPYHPRYYELQQRDDQRASFYTNPDANAWVDLAIDASRSIRAHVLLESCLRRTNEVIATTTSYLQAGFGAEMHLVVTHPFLSRLAVAERYLGQIEAGEPGRYVVTETQAESIDLLVDSARALAASGFFDNIGLHRRDGTLIASGALLPGELRDAYHRELEQQVATLDVPAVLARIAVALDHAERHGRHECRDDLLALRNDLKGKS